MADAAGGQQGAAGDDVAQFVALTGSTTDTAAFMLEATHGNLEQAVQMYLGESPCPRLSQPTRVCCHTSPTYHPPAMLSTPPPSLSCCSCHCHCCMLMHQPQPTEQTATSLLLGRPLQAHLQRRRGCGGVGKQQQRAGQQGQLQQQVAPRSRGASGGPRGACWAFPSSWWHLAYM